MPAKFRAPSIVAALPDLTTAAIFLTAWIIPKLFGPAWIMSMGLSLLNEVWLIFLIWFFCVAVWKNEGPSTLRRRWILAAFMVLLFPVFFLLLPQYAALSQTAITFAWLLSSRMFDIWLHSGRGVEEGKRLTIQLTLALVTWVPLAICASASRLPQLGITPEFSNALNQYAGHGGWPLDPKRVLAFGMAYFLIQALIKFLQAWFAAHPEESWLARLKANR